MSFADRARRIGLAALLASALAAPALAFDRLTIIAPAAPGGGWDSTARSMQDVLQTTGIAKSVQVENVAQVLTCQVLGQHLHPRPDPADRDRPRELLRRGLGRATRTGRHGASLPAPGCRSGLEVPGRPVSNADLLRGTRARARLRWRRRGENPAIRLLRRLSAGGGASRRRLTRTRAPARYGRRSTPPSPRSTTRGSRCTTRTPATTR